MTDEAIRVLLVDDDPGVRMTLAANLELDGHVVVEAASPREALALARTESIDLMVTDIQMPGMNGIELFREIRKLRPTLPSIIMTAFAVENIVTQGIEEGVYTVLYKPFAVEVFLALVRSAARGGAVVVVDDLPNVAFGMAESLNAVGLSAVDATSGEQALNVLAHSAVDVCVVDLVMPGMNGPELCERIARGQTPVGIITMTGHDQPELMLQAFRSGSYVCLRKPFEVGALLRAITDVRRNLAESQSKAPLDPQDNESARQTS